MGKTQGTQCVFLLHWGKQGIGTILLLPTVSMSRN